VKSVDAILLELYDELVIAIRCSRLFTGERFSAGPATLLLDGEKIIGYVGENEHDEAQFIAKEIDRLAMRCVAPAIR